MKAGMLAKALALLVVVAATLSAQVPTGMVRGRIIDSLGTPIAGADVGAGPVRTKTDREGKFELAAIPMGETRVYVRRIGYQPLTVRVRLYTPDTLEKTFTMFQLTWLDTVRVFGNRELPSGPATFERRRRAGWGTFLDSAVFSKTGATRASDVIATELGFRTVNVCGRAFIVGRRATAPGALEGGGRGPLVGAGCYLPIACYAQVFFDGLRIYAMDGPLTERSAIPPNFDNFTLFAVHGIELYRGPADTPSELNGSGATCGTVAIWTKR